MSTAAAPRPPLPPEVRPVAARRTVLLGLLAALLCLAVPAGASAATVVAGQRCALAGSRSFNLATNGWLPGSPLTIALGGKQLGTGVADATGAFSTLGNPLTAPLLAKPRVKTLKLTVTDGTTTTPAVKTKVVARGVNVPDHAKPAQTVRYKAFGFPPHKRLYLHVRRGGKTKGSFRIGRAKGVCGLTQRKLRYMPLRRWSTGIYDYWFSDTKHFRAARTLYGYRIKITRRFR
jgi:hypothetical protein